MRKSSLLLICLSVLVVGSCSKATPPAAVPSSSATSATPAASPGSDSSQSNAASAAITTSQGKVSVCDLLTSKDLQAVQGEALKEAKPSARSEGGFLISQCFYSLPTFTNSISLLVSQRGETLGARDPKDYWKETFGRADEEEREKAREKESEREKEREQEKAKEKDKGKGKAEPAANKERVEDERGAPPMKISGIGDDAYWTGNRVGGALYVLKGNTYFRISVGGAADQQTKIKRATALAQLILKRL